MLGAAGIKGGTSSANTVLSQTQLSAVIWRDQIVSGLTTWHNCCQHELLPLGVGRVKSAKSFPVWNKASESLIVE